MTASIFGSGATTLGLLAASRNIAVPGAPGLSARSRQLTQDYLSQMSSSTNSLFSSTAGSAYTSIEDLQKQVFAIRASLSEDRLAPSLRGNVVDEQA